MISKQHIFILLNIYISKVNNILTNSIKSTDNKMWNIQLVKIVDRRLREKE